MLPPIAPPFSKKGVIRERMRAERKAAAAARPDAAKHAARNFIATINVPAGAVVSLYHPLADELDTLPLAEALLERGARLALPVVVRRAAPLIFREWRPGDALVRGRHGAMTPAEDANLVEPQILVVPLVAFARGGERLGQGGGYYDRTIAALRGREVVAIGYAYGAQEVDALPVSDEDQPLHWIVTEREAIRTGR